jgi:hypothetical protein
VVRLERAKIGKEQLSIKKICTAPSTFNQCDRNMPLQRKGMEIAMFLPIAAGKFSLLPYWLVADIWAFPSGLSYTL